MPGTFADRQVRANGSFSLMYSTNGVCGVGLGVAALNDESIETQLTVGDGVVDAVMRAARLITAVVVNRILPVHRDVGVVVGGFELRWM
jgi:hypothetical protein